MRMTELQSAEITRLRAIVEPLEELLATGRQVGLSQDEITGLWYVYDWEHLDGDSPQGNATLPEALAAAVAAVKEE